MSRIIKTRRAKVLLGAMAALAVTAVAFAFWTATGSGTGSATSSAGTSVTVGNIAFDDGLYPGKSEAVTFDVTNDSSTEKAYVGSETLSIDSVKDVNGDAITADCADDFVISQQPDAIAAEIDPSDTVSPTGGEITMNDTTSNQDACKGAVVTVKAEANAS
jgi:hypothetical protein